MKAALWTTTLACALACAGCGPAGGSTADRGDASPATTAAAEDAPPAAAAAPAAETVDLQILDWQGVQELVARQRGKVVVLDVWMTACDPCLREFPGLVALHRRYDREDVTCISLSLDYEGRKDRAPEYYREKVLGYLRDFGATFDNVLMSEMPDAILGKLKLGSPPAVYVYGRDGELARRFDNQQVQREEDEFTYADVGKLVAELVAAPAAAPGDPAP